MERSMSNRLDMLMHYALSDGNEGFLFLGCGGGRVLERR